VFFGRLGNFLNGELFGRVTAVPWAVKFPTELLHEDFIHQGGVPVALPASARSSPEIIASFERGGGGRAQLEALLHPRHPSQIYEALGEGLLIFAVLYFLRVRFPKLPHGMLAGIYFLAYAVARIAVETLRQPDSGSQPVLGMTHGQFYSLFMIAVGLALLVRALCAKKNSRSR
jgi:phosphatidylglycerol:prolipoprotein diacylglycerol transferase